MSETLYTRVVGLTEQYLGPAAPRFIDRHIISHLDKKPQDLTPEDLDKLTDWARISFALLTNDVRMINDFASKLSRLKEET